jgi:hypothetical protein
MIRRLYLNAGQMKAGTTFLYRILRHHPAIHFSPEKELHFLSQQLGPIRLLSDQVRRRKALSLVAASEKNGDTVELQRLLRWAGNYLDPPEGWQWYEAALAGARPDQYAADFSNLTCTIPPEGLRQVRDRFEAVKVTYCVRDPVERAFSHMKFHLKFAGRDVRLDAVSRDELFELVRSDNILLQSRTATHLSALRDVFGDDFRIIRCEEMWVDAATCVTCLCGFLGLPGIDISSADLRPVNVGPVQARSEAVIAAIEEFLADEIEATHAALQEHASLILNPEPTAPAPGVAASHIGPNETTRP